MKHYVPAVLPVWAFITAVFFLESCKKDSAPATPMGIFAIHTHTYLDTIEAEYHALYTMRSGRKIVLDSAQVFLSGFTLFKSDGSTVSIPNAIALKTMTGQGFLLGLVPAGEYTGFSMNTGLNSTVSHKTPVSTDSCLYDHSMWYNSTAQADNYMFIRFEGRVDTSRNANGSLYNLAPFHYYIGTSAAYQTATLTRNITIAANTVNYQHIVVEYTKLFNNMDFTNLANLSITTPFDNASANGIRALSNIPYLYRYEY